MICILVFVSFYYLVCSSNEFSFFVLRFMFVFLFGPLRLLHCRRKIIPLVGCQPLSALFHLIFYPHHLVFFLRQIWWIIRTFSISKISIAYVLYKPPQSDIIIIRSQTPHLDLKPISFVLRRSAFFYPGNSSRCLPTPSWCSTQST